MFEEDRTNSDLQSVWLTEEASIRESVTGARYMQFRGLLYSPEDAVPGSIYGRENGHETTARQFVIACLTRQYGNQAGNWPPLAYDFVNQPSERN
jgi:hypothetical protein